MVEACVVGELSPPAPYPDELFEKLLVKVDANSLRSPTSSSRWAHCAFLPVESDSDGFNLMYPPALKKYLASLPPANVTVDVAVTVVFQEAVKLCAVLDSVMLPESAVNLALYNVVISADKLAIAAMASPADTENDEMLIDVP